MKIKNLLLGLCVSSALFSCGKSDVSGDQVSSTKIYTGTILAKDCPSFAFVLVNDDPIGDPWTLNETYQNVITLSNCPDSIGGKISFKLSTSSNWIDCQILSPCPAVVYYASYPKKKFCATAIKSIQ